MISNKRLDEVREALIDTWEPSAFFIWHRDYKDYKDVQCPYAGQKVIVVQFRGFTILNGGHKIGFIPFIYGGVQIKLWK